MSRPSEPPTILGLIPARGRSRRLANKNLQPLCGRPMIDYTLQAAVEAGCLAAVLLSTDDPAIARRGEAFGVRVPFLRPARLAADDADVTDVILHALDFLAARGEQPDAPMLLQPTSPLRTAEDIRSAVRLFTTKDCDGVVSVVADPGGPALLRTMGEDGRLEAAADSKLLGLCNRQQRPAVFRLNGAIYLRRAEVYRQWKARVAAGRNPEGGRVLGCEMPAERSVDVDDPVDFALAEALLRQRAPGAGLPADRSLEPVG